MKKPRKAPKPPKGESGAFRIKLRGKDGTPLSMQELRDGLLEAARRLQQHHSTHRAKWATLYITMVDTDGSEVRPDPPGEWEIIPYRSAADEYAK